MGYTVVLFVARTRCEVGRSMPSRLAKSMAPPLRRRPHPARHAVLQVGGRPPQARHHLRREVAARELRQQALDVVGSVPARALDAPAIEEPAD